MSSPDTTWLDGPPTWAVVRLTTADLVFLVEVVDHDVEHEPVELGFGQRVSSFHLDRVLRGQHEERRVQRVTSPPDGDLVLLHRLEQRRLRLGRRAVDLVGQNHVGEHRARDELASGACRSDCLPR